MINAIPHHSHIKDPVLRHPRKQKALQIIDLQSKKIGGGEENGSVGGTPGGNKLPGFGATIFSLFNVKWIRPQHFALQRRYSLFRLIIVHLNDSFSLA
jgi:hypothetical protein